MRRTTSNASAACLTGILVFWLAGGHFTLGVDTGEHHEAPVYEHLGPRFEIKVEQDGLYRLTYESLIAAGLARGAVPASTLSMQSQGRDIAILIEGAEDGSFGPGDSILFYGEKFRGDNLAALYGSFMDGPNGWLQLCRGCKLSGVFEKYTDQNVYWLLIGPKPGLRMETLDARPTGAPRAETYRDKLRQEESHIWWTFEFESEDAWFWDRINEPVWTQVNAGAFSTKTVERRYPFRVSNLAPGEHRANLSVGLVSRNRAGGTPDHHTQLALNDQEPLADETWEGGLRRRIEIEFPQSQLKEGENVVKFTELPRVGEQLVALGVPWIYFDWFEVTYARRFVAHDNKLIFETPESGLRQYEIEGFTDRQIMALELSDPLKPKLLAGGRETKSETTTLTFDAKADTRTPFLVVGEPAIRQPSVSFCRPPDFRQANESDYLMISDPVFFDELQVLADYRRSQGLTVTVVDIRDLYREFNHGIPHPVAIRNFLAFAFEKWTKPPQYAALIGWGHWNFKGFPEFPSPQAYVPPNLAYVDPFQGEVDSTTLLGTIVGGDPIPDIHIGRIPAKSPEELKRYIRKVIDYESAPASEEPTKAVFVVDNVPDRAANFVDVANRLIDTFLGPESGLEVRKIYLNDFKCQKAKTVECETVKEAIITALNSEQALLVNYLGHSTIGEWAHEKVLEVGDLSRLKPGRRLPVLVSLTCLDGYWFHPRKPSLVNELLLSPGGIVAAFAPSGMGLSSGHDVLHRGFYDALLKKGIREFGPAVMEARKRLHESGRDADLLFTYILFGDPALKLPKLAK